MEILALVYGMFIGIPTLIFISFLLHREYKKADNTTQSAITAIIIIPVIIIILIGLLTNFYK